MKLALLLSSLLLLGVGGQKPTPQEYAAEIQAAYTEAIRLAPTQPSASLPYFRRALELVKVMESQGLMLERRFLFELHLNYGAALANAATSTHLRSSIERLASIRQAFAEWQLCARLKPGEAKPWANTLQVLWVWGFEEEMSRAWVLAGGLGG